MDSYIIKLSGNAELPEALNIGHNFKVELSGSIVSETIEDNEDGTKSHYFKFKPILVEAIKPTGERLKAKDTRSRSQQLRALIFKIWRSGNYNETFDEFYDRTLLDIMQKL